jgi:hypothetical protein
MQLPTSFFAIWPIEFDVAGLRFPDSDHANNLTGIALAFSAEHLSGHAAVLYPLSPGDVRVLHYSGEVHHDPLGHPYYVWSSLSLEDEQVRQVRRLCYLIARSSAYGSLQIEYAYPFAESARFEIHNGMVYFIPSGECTGLTCATFVMLVLLTCGVRLLNLKTWKSTHEDRAAIQQTVDRLLGDARFGHLIPAFERDIRTNRYQPDDVVATALLPEVPVDFFPARLVGRFVRTRTYKYSDRANLRYKRKRGIIMRAWHAIRPYRI